MSSHCCQPFFQCVPAGPQAVAHQMSLLVFLHVRALSMKNHPRKSMFSRPTALVLTNLLTLPDIRNSVILVTSSWTGTARGIGPPPFASLRPQSPYSSVYLKVGDIFCGRL